MGTIWFILDIVFAIICTIIHTKKGYSPITGFLWGFLLSIIGLIVVLLESNKEEHEKKVKDKNGLSFIQWLLIFVGIGVLLIIIFFVIMSII